MNLFSDRIAYARKRMGLSQSQLATTLGVSRGACGQWEQGVSTPSVSHMAELARITEVSFEWLATGRGALEIGSSNATVDEGRVLAGRKITGELREVLIWLQKLPEEKRSKVMKILRNMRGLIEE